MAERTTTQSRPSFASTAAAGSRRTGPPPRASGCRSAHRGDDRGAAPLALRLAEALLRGRARRLPTIPKEYGGGGHKGFQQIANQEMGRAARAVHDQRHRPRHGGADDPPPRHRGAEAPLPAAALRRRRDLVPGLLRAERRQRPRERAGVGRPRGRQLDHQRPQGVDEPRALRELDDHALPHAAATHKYDGLTYFIVPIADTKGVTVRPLIKMTGETGFNEVLFEDVVVPDTLRVDEVGKGWTVAMTTLALRARRRRGRGQRRRPLARRAHPGADRAREAHRGATASRRGTMRSSATRSCSSRSAPRAFGRRRGACASSRSPTIRCACRCRRRCWSASCCRTSPRVGARDRGRARVALPRRRRSAPDGGQWPLAYMNSYGFTIAAGSNEIQRNILGERVLGLAKSK